MHNISFLPVFTNNDSITRFKPGLVYERRNRQPHNAIRHPSLAPAPTPDSNQQQLLRRSSRPSHPPERYGFSHSSLHTTLSSISIPDTYSQAIKQPCWQQVMSEELTTHSSSTNSHIGYCSSSISCQTHRLQVDLLCEAQARWVLGSI